AYWVDIPLALNILAPAHQLLWRVEAEHSGQRWLGRKKTPLGRALANAFTRLLENRAVFLFRVAESLLRPLALNSQSNLICHRAEKLQVTRAVGACLFVVLHSQNADRARRRSQGDA